MLLVNLGPEVNLLVLDWIVNLAELHTHKLNTAEPTNRWFPDGLLMSCAPCRN